MFRIEAGAGNAEGGGKGTKGMTDDKKGRRGLV